MPVGVFDPLPPDKPKRNWLSSYTMIGGGAVVAIVLIQVLLLRAVGDLFTSALIFGIGVFVGSRINR